MFLFMVIGAFFFWDVNAPHLPTGKRLHLPWHRHVARRRGVGSGPHFPTPRATPAYGPPLDPHPVT